MTTRLLDPTGELEPATREPLEKPASLQGLTLGLLDISKARGDVFLDRLDARPGDHTVGADGDVDRANDRAGGLGRARAGHAFTDGAHGAVDGAGFQPRQDVGAVVVKGPGDGQVFLGEIAIFVGDKDGCEAEPEGKDAVDRVCGTHGACGNGQGCGE